MFTIIVVLVQANLHSTDVVHPYRITAHDVVKEESNTCNIYVPRFPFEYQRYSNAACELALRATALPLLLSLFLVCL